MTAAAPRARLAGRNVVANFAGRLWSLVSMYVFVPLYLRALGVEAYGVVGFYTVVQGVLTFADAGLTAALSREAARLRITESGARELRDVVRTVELVYLAVWSLVALGLWFASPFVATRWLNPGALAPEAMLFAVRAMAIAIPLQFFAGFYIGGLMGLERQVTANALQIAWSTVRSGGAAAALLLVNATLPVFFTVQVLANAVYVLATRVTLLRAMPAPQVQGAWSPAVLRRLTHYIGGMTLLSILSAILVQADKLAVSTLLPLAALGAYSIAATLAQLPMSFAWPFASAAFPNLTTLAERAETAALTETYHRACQFVAVAVAPASLVIAAFGRDLVNVWTGRPGTADAVAAPLVPLAIGSLFLALQLVPFQLALAHAWIRLNVILSTLSVVVIVPLLLVLIRAHGPVGGGMAWLLLNVAVTPPLIVFLHRRLLPGQTARWVRDDFIRPVGTAAIVVLAGWLVLPPLHGARAVLLPGMFGALALLASMAATPATQPYLRAVFRRTAPSPSR